MGIDELGATSTVAGNFNASLVSSVCTHKQYAIPSSFISAPNTSVTLCNELLYDIFLDLNNVGFYVNIYVDPMFAPHSNESVSISALIALDCNSVNYHPQAIIPALPGEPGSFISSFMAKQPH